VMGCGGRRALAEEAVDRPAMYRKRSAKFGAAHASAPCIHIAARPVEKEKALP
jgi:hypothetical protein